MSFYRDALFFQRLILSRLAFFYILMETGGTGWIFHKILDLNLEELFFEEYRCEYSFVRSILKKKTIKYRKSDRNRYVSSAHSSTAAFL